MKTKKELENLFKEIKKWNKLNSNKNSKLLVLGILKIKEKDETKLAYFKWLDGKWEDHFEVVALVESWKLRYYFDKIDRTEGNINQFKKTIKKYKADPRLKSYDQRTGGF